MSKVSEWWAKRRTEAARRECARREHDSEPRLNPHGVEFQHCRRCGVDYLEFRIGTMMPHSEARIPLAYDANGVLLSVGEVEKRPIEGEAR